MDVPISSLKGYEQVKELIPNGSLLLFTQIWSLRVQNVLTGDGDFQKNVILELAKDFAPDDADIIRITMRNAGGCVFDNTSQITGFAVLDVQAKQWDGIRYEIYDYEQSAIKLYCEDIEMEKSNKKIEHIFA